MEERKLCPFKKTVDRETNGFTGKQTMHERFEVCAGSRGAWPIPKASASA